MKKLSNPLRFTLLLVAALALAFGLEVFCYAISYYDSENYEYEEVDLSLCTNAYGEYLSLDDGIVTVPARDSYEVYITDLCVGPSASVRFTFSGASLPLEFDVMLQDDSCTDSYAEAYTAYCVPSSASMSSVDCVVRSNGDLYGLCLKFPSSYEREQEVFLEAAEINPPAASFSVCAERFTVAFLLIFFLLFLFLFPWRSIYYQCGGVRSHTLALVIPMLGLMVLSVCFSVHMLPAQDGDIMRGLWKGQTMEQATSDFRNPYPHLMESFAAGQFSLLEKPSEELLSLDNPYDRTQRKDVDCLWDYALYNDEYYVYFGLAPLLLVYYPFYWLTGLVPSMSLCSLLLALIAIPLLFSAVVAFARKYCRRVHLFLLVLACCAAAYTSCGPFLSMDGSRYNNATLANIAVMAGAISFGLRAVMQKKRGRRIACFLLCGIFFALQAMARATTLLITTACLAPAFVGVLYEKKSSLSSKVRDASCFLIPALIGVGFVMYYNYARFGSVAEFGATHQLTTNDIHYNSFQLSHLPLAIVHFFFDLPQIAFPFPYVKMGHLLINTTGKFLFREDSIGVLAWPLLWSLFLIVPAQRRRQDGICRTERVCACVLPLATAFGLMLFTFFYAGISLRYTHDFLPILSIISCYAGLTLADGEQSDGLLYSFQNIFAILCVLTCILSVLIACQSLRLVDTEWIFSLLNRFFPFV